MTRVQWPTIALLAVLWAACDSSPTSPSYLDVDDRFDLEDEDADSGNGTDLNAICEVELIDTATTHRGVVTDREIQPAFNMLFRCAGGGEAATVLVSARVWSKATGRLYEETRLSTRVEPYGESWLCNFGIPCTFPGRIPRSEGFRWRANWKSCPVATAGYPWGCDYPDYPSRP